MLPLRDSTSGQQRQTLLRTDIPVFHRALTRRSITKGTAKMNRKLNLRIQQSSGEPSVEELPALPTCLQRLSISWRKRDAATLPWRN